MIVVTTPTGTIGRLVLEKVLDGAEPVRVIVRDPAKLPSRVRERVEVVSGSHGDGDVVHRAFAGADSVFWNIPPEPDAASVEAAYVDFTRPACDAFKHHRVKRVVGVSSLGRGKAENAGYVTASLAMDDLIASTGVNYRALTMPLFMDNILRQADSIRSRSVFVSPIGGDLKVPACATRDIADVAARLLLDHSWSGQDTVPVLGPEDLSFNDMARIMSEVLGKAVRFEQIPSSALEARLTGAGMSQAMARGTVDLLAAVDAGLYSAASRTKESTMPTSFRQWCEEVLRPAVLRTY